MKKNEIYSTHAHVNRDFFIFLTFQSFFDEVYTSRGFDVFLTIKKQKNGFLLALPCFFCIFAPYKLYED